MTENGKTPPVDDWLPDDEYPQDADDMVYCPTCGSADLHFRHDIFDEEFGIVVASAFTCNDCGHRFEEY